MNETDTIIMDSVLAQVPDMRDRRFSGRYKRRRKRIIANPEKEAGLVGHVRFRARYLLVVALIAVLTVFITLVSSAEPEKRTESKPNISAYELLGVTEFDQLFVTHGIEREFYIDTDLSGYTEKEYMRRNDRLRKQYTKGNTVIKIDQAVFYYGIPYLYGDTMQVEPQVTTVNGWDAVYFESTYGSCGYIINTGEYLMGYECNSGKELLDSFVTATKFREVSGNDDS